jgi:hypothetical protein
MAIISQIILVTKKCSQQEKPTMRVYQCHIKMARKHQTSAASLPWLFLIRNNGEQKKVVVSQSTMIIFLNLLIMK